jgi:hypothetical protein
MTVGNGQAFVQFDLSLGCLARILQVRTFLLLVGRMFVFQKREANQMIEVWYQITV